MIMQRRLSGMVDASTPSYGYRLRCKEWKDNGSVDEPGGLNSRRIVKIFAASTEIDLQIKLLAKKLGAQRRRAPTAEPKRKEGK